MLGTLSAARASHGLLRGCFLPGLTASAYREMLYSGSKAGFYVPLRNWFLSLQPAASSPSDAPARVAAALCTGCLGSLIANPVDLVKIRLMSNPAAYPSALAALPLIYANEGARGLYRGLLPSTLRGAAVSAGELATYDIAKHALKARWEGGVLGVDGAPLHVAASLITGLVAAVVAAPFDLIKARAMNGRGAAVGVGSVLRALHAEGALPLGLFRGLLPAYLRLGPHALIAFPIFEAMRSALGLEPV